MTWWHTHPDAARIVRDHWRAARLVLVARSEPCLSIREQELGNIRRTASSASAEELRRWRPRGSWLVAVLLCPDDDTAELANVVKDRGLDPHRFHFYLHKDAARSALAAWAEAGLPLDAVDEGITDWKTLHKLVGLDFNVRIVDDALDHARR